MSSPRRKGSIIKPGEIRVRGDWRQYVEEGVSLTVVKDLANAEAEVKRNREDGEFGTERPGFVGNKTKKSKKGDDKQVILGAVSGGGCKLRFGVEMVMDAESAYFKDINTMAHQVLKVLFQNIYRESEKRKQNLVKRKTSFSNLVRGKLDSMFKSCEEGAGIKQQDRFNKKSSEDDLCGGLEEAGINVDQIIMRVWGVINELILGIDEWMILKADSGCKEQEDEEEEDEEEEDVEGKKKEKKKDAGRSYSLSGLQIPFDEQSKEELIAIKKNLALWIAENK
jgi:hypothetical protein